MPTAHFADLQYGENGGDYSFRNNSRNLDGSGYQTKQSSSQQRQAANKVLTIGTLSKRGYGFYEAMMPSFTNAKRQRAFESDTKKGGFTYVNWDIEEELWRFQKEIEQKYAQSLVN